ncbi:hypothetical protein DFQ28_010885 [Apophysomyces sp. BC1034]|nr:hypothetical protein DFQ30_010575 [Apophysomyces sp. BC1015]KAG0170191.1 hypothetical protein DFQ29_009383 [Apophysomyces sp. BC1021]KAG0184588.1 hypothetical protein DFQ28_010885 [Apophysomyces sp. BC1034]
MEQQTKFRPTSRLRSTSPVTSTPSIRKNHTRAGNSSSQWQQLVVGAGSAAGSTVAVVSEESMKCLKYCLTWLQYAIQHIDQQMTLLRNFLVSLATAQSGSAASLTVPYSGSSLSQIKKDIVNTLRKVVEVVSHYASSALPHHAKVAVRGSILDLPSRWASLSDIQSNVTTPTSSPLLRPNGEKPKGHEEKAIRLLSFGQESLETLQSISTVFSDTIDRAEGWLDRLRMVRGLDTTDEKPGDESHLLPPIRTLDEGQCSSPSEPKVD